MSFNFFNFENQIREFQRIQIISQIAKERNNKARPVMRKDHQLVNHVVFPAWNKRTRSSLPYKEIDSYDNVGGARWT